MKKSKFADSGEKLKRKEFRKWAADTDEWPGSRENELFDNAVEEIDRRRSAGYAEAIMKRYPRNWLDKVLRWAADLSLLELSRLKNFEKLSAKFIDANQDRVSSSEVAQFYDPKSGKKKAFPKAPEETELYGIEADADGNVKETVRPSKKKAERPPLLSMEKARRMSMKEWKEMFESQGVDPADDASILEANRD